MAHAHTTLEADYSSTARRYSGVLLLLAIASLLVACGGGAGESGLGGGGGGAVTCITGPAPTVLTWDAATGAAGYRIYFGTTSGTYPQTLTVGNVTTTNVTGLSSGTTYYFVATAYDSSNPPNESSFSNAVCKTIS